MAERILAPLDGTLITPPQFLDFHSQQNPDLPFCLFPSPDNPANVASITLGEMDTASHVVAHTLRPNRAGPDDETVAVVINTDTVLYVALLLGMLRAGLVVSNTKTLLLSR